ncbi:tyrosine-type recombinase/integrase [Tepidicaulis sp. LMO-SS28]|uniref:tyrosine-type recombinase/integrase n=1 Tax=Tepidicaulis sp. LMO-SS28 TaxID=3447455 RepID=UPI003EDF3B45
MATYERRGPYQIRVKIRRRGRSVSRTFETLSEAKEWARIEEGRITGDDYVDRRRSQRTSLKEACDVYEAEGIRPSPDSANKKSKLRYWRATEFADWSIVSIQPKNLIDWRGEVLDEDSADEGEVCGPDAEVKPATVVQRLNVLSGVYKHWRATRDMTVMNPVIATVRPSVKNDRSRRVYFEEEKELLAAVRQSSRPWLETAVIVSIESAVRQGELAKLIWGNVYLSGRNPYLDLPARDTKTRMARRVPLSRRAVNVLRSWKKESQAERVVGPATRVFCVETPRSIGRAWREAVSHDEFPDLHWHDLRHEAISRFFENTDLKDLEIMSISGHQDTAMLKRYTHLRTPELAERLNQRPSSPSGRQAKAAAKRKNA